MELINLSNSVFLLSIDKEEGLAVAMNELGGLTILESIIKQVSKAKAGDKIF